MRTEYQQKSCEEAKELELSHAEYWRGKHRGIAFKIHRHNASNWPGIGDRNAWAYYVYLCPLNFSPSDWEKVCPKAEVYEMGGVKRTTLDTSHFDCGDFHGGITWADMKSDPNTPDQVTLEIGCDYSHLFDKERMYLYDIEGILREVKSTIDKFHENFSLLLWSFKDGTYHPESELQAYNTAVSVGK